VEDVEFKGNHHFEDKQLARLVLVKKGRVAFGHFFSRGEYSDDLLRKSVNALTAAYKDSGFADVVITPKVTDHERSVDVTFEVSEGDQYKVNTLKMENSGKQPVETDTGKHPLNLQPSKPYSPHLLQDDRNRILARYLDIGYLNAQFRSSVTPSANNPHLVDVVYTIDEGPRVQIDGVAILGEKRTRRSFISKVAGPKISTGQPMSLGNFLKSESDLYNLGIFDWVSVKPVAPISEQRQEEVLVKVAESPRNSVDFGGGFEVIPRSGNIPVGTVALPGIPPIGLGSKFRGSQQSYWGPRVSFEFARHDLRGNAETAAFGLVYSRLDQRASFTYTIPRLSGSSWSSLFSLSAERSTQISIYTAEIAGASWQVQKSLDAKRTRNLIFRYSYHLTSLTNITIPDLVLPQDQHVRLSTFDVEYVRDTRDKPLDAHHGVYQTFDFGVSPTALGSSADFVRFFSQTSFYRPLKPWLTWANNFRLGLAIPFAGSIVPLSERFFSGGADSLRGFPINGAGPQRPVTVCSNPNDPSTCTLISVPVGGDMLAIFNSELRFPIPLKKDLGGVLFYDGGNVYKNINLRQFGDDYTHTIGFGFRYKTPVGPIRFDVGRRLTSVPGVNATQYFVTLGQAF
jgi:outer membrane protein insertion porin family